MNSDELLPWPSFELVPLPLDPLKAIETGVHLSDLAQGVPKSFLGRYSALEAPFIVPLQGRGQLVTFGRSPGQDSFCLDPSTREVVHVTPAPHVRGAFINTSLAHFARTVKAVILRFPFYRPEDGLPVWKAVGEELATLVRGLDPPAMNTNCYWSEFVWDVKSGDYGTEWFAGPSVSGC